MDFIILVISFVLYRFLIGTFIMNVNFLIYSMINRKRNYRP